MTDTYLFRRDRNEPSGYRLDRDAGLLLPLDLDRRDDDEETAGEVLHTAIASRSQGPAAEPWPDTAEAIDALAPADTDGMLRVFRPTDVLDSRESVMTQRSETRNRLMPALRQATREGGWRSLPWTPAPVADGSEGTGPADCAPPTPFTGFGPEAENFREVIEHLQCQWTLACHAVRPADARIDPILLVGAPGVGKTLFARRFAAAMGTRCEVYSAAAAEEAFQLVGTDTGWSNTAPGLIYTMLARHDSAAPILVIDEVDKVRSSGYRNSPVNALLDLLEPESACRWKDTGMQLRCDASRVIVLATANDARCVSAPLLSRCTVFDVPPPTPAQRRLIVEQHFEDLRRTHHCPEDLRLDEAGLRAAAEHEDIREALREVRQGFARTLRYGSTVVTVTVRRTGARKRIGFV